MKIILAHNARQHCHQVLIALQNRAYLLYFFTGIASNTFEVYKSHLPNRLWSSLQKRFFPGLKTDQIKQNLIFVLLEYLFRKNSNKTAKIAYYYFDYWVSKKIRSFDGQLIITYENVNLATLQQAKKQGMIAILDLAGIHHQRSSQLKQQFGIGDPAETPELLAWINRRKEQAYQYTDYVFALSAFAKETLLEGGIAADRIYLLTLGVNLQNFVPKTTYPQSGTFKLLYVGAMVRAKGLETLLKAWVDMNLPAAELILIGGGTTDIDFLKPFMGHYQHIPHLDHQSLAEAYREANVFVSPSYLDSWAQTVIEALACGTPVITTENTGAKDAVLQGGGLVIPAGDEDALKKSIVYFYNNREQIEIMGRKGRQIAEQYTWENYHRQVIAAVEDIARRENIPLS
jgi:glycosyltransferase involved in cell wall biosynthesis